jgi:HD-GYP domain-containing protein (c-di-GMP phosphodiesterase class II)
MMMRENINMFSENPRINSLIDRTVNELKMFTEEQARNINDLVQIGAALSAERDLNKVLEMILTQARRFTNSDGGTLYMMTDDDCSLAFHVLHNETLNSYMGGTSGNEINIPNVLLYNSDGTPNYSNVSAYVALEGKIVNIPDVYEAEGFNFEGPRKFDAAFDYRSMSMLVIPMRDHESEIIGVLQLINAKDRDTNKTIPFHRDHEDMVSALASQAAVALTQQRLINDMKDLFDSFIKAIATAIDEKSKYTGGHIERVANLTMMIAEKLNESKEGPYSEIAFDDSQMEELRLAAWLHDTGKIVTPEYVVDKANKLETIFDRIELVKTRWQLLRTTRRLEAIETLLDSVKKHLNPTLKAEVEEKLSYELETLNSDLEFLTTANTGGEFFSDEKVERLNEIAGKDFDYNGEMVSALTDDEVLNLSIRKGTLNDSEREIMNNHASMSIKILEELPWPKKLKDVPSIAGAHHEKLDGSGYPIGLDGKEISLQARIMAVADIFEALSAKDRPYKKPMPLSQAIKILGFMVKDNHLDKDVVDLFINSGLVSVYAEKYLDMSQVDIEGNA